MFRSSISRNRPQRTCDCDCVDNGFIIDNAICSTIRPPTTALAQFLRTFCGWRFDLWPLTPHPVRRLPSPVTVGVARFVGELRNGFVIRINNPNDYFVLQKLYLLNWYLSFRGARARAHFRIFTYSLSLWRQLLYGCCLMATTTPTTIVIK